MVQIWESTEEPMSGSTQRSRQYDIIVYGAEGLTGQYVVENLVNLPPHFAPPSLTWAVAGKNESQLTQVLEVVSERTGRDLSNVDKIVADATDLDGVKEMVAQTRVVINCVGPFWLYGRNVVKACLEHGTHLVEAAGEAPYLLQRYVDFDEGAERSGVYVIGACAWASLFVDSGTVLLQQLFEGQLNSVQSYYEMDKKVMSQASYLCLVYICSQFKIWKKPNWELESRICGGHTPKFPVPHRLMVHYSKEQGYWAGRNSMHCDAVIAKQSQDYFYRNKEIKSPAQVETFVKFDSFVIGLLMSIMTGLFGLLALTHLGRKALKAFPGFFSGGVAKSKVPTEEVESLNFKFTLIGRGWNNSLGSDLEEHEEPPNTNLTLEMSGKNPFYDLSAKMLLHGALIIFQEKDKLPSRGGVYTPGVAFAETTMLERLVASGLDLRVRHQDRSYSLKEARDKRSW